MTTAVDPIDRILIRIHQNIYSESELIILNLPQYLQIILNGRRRKNINQIKAFFKTGSDHNTRIQKLWKKHPKIMMIMKYTHPPPPTSSHIIALYEAS